MGERDGGPICEGGAGRRQQALGIDVAELRGLNEAVEESPELLIGLPWFATAGFGGACWYLVAHTLHVHAVASGLAGFLAAFAVGGMHAHARPRAPGTAHLRCGLGDSGWTTA